MFCGVIVASENTTLTMSETGKKKKIALIWESERRGAAVRPEEKLSRITANLKSDIGWWRGMALMFPE